MLVMGVSAGIMLNARPLPRFRYYVAIALVSCAVLLYEITITRVLSVVLWYHFAFLAISLAMLGLGAPGVWFTIKKPGERSLERSLVLSGWMVPASIIGLLKGSEWLPHVGGGLPGLSSLGNPEILLVVVCLLAPMLCLGSAVCLLLMRAEGPEVGRMYAADLIGATLGALAVVPLLDAFPTPHIVASAGFLPLGAALFVAQRPPWGALAAALSLLACLLANEPLHLRVAKSYVEPDNLLYVKWTPTARITVHPNIFYVKDPRAGFGWGMGWNYEPRPLEQLWIEQDASAGTPITHLETTPAALTHLFYDVTSIGYQLRSPARVCIVGAGGGRDVLAALKAGATHVDAVELNGHIVSALSGPFREFSGDVYHLPGVHAVVGEGRSFLTHSEGNYDFIQISLIDSWAATAAGAFALSENYLYTVEALRLYLKRTNPEGIVSISRWMSGDRQLEGARLAELASRALRLEGVSDPARHVVVFQAWDVGTFLISRAPFDDVRMAKLDSIAEDRGFRRRWPVPEDTDQDTAVASVMAEGSSKYQKEGLDLSASTDDRPFFFQTVSLFGKVDPSFFATLSNNEHSVALLRMLLSVMGALTAVLFFTPFLFGDRMKRTPGLWYASGYFLCIGLAFMLVEVPWMQRFVLYLGHPSYASTVVLTSLLLGAGLGSTVASRVGMQTVRRWGLCLPVVLLGVNLGLFALFEATLGLPFLVRVAISGAVLVPTGFLMGFAFPLGMANYAQEHRPWLWAINGAASVLASVFSLALSIEVGFLLATTFGIAFYVAAYLLLVFRSGPALPEGGIVGAS
jgi:hypothetical protein